MAFCCVRHGLTRAQLGPLKTDEADCGRQGYAAASRAASDSSARHDVKAGSGQVRKWLVTNDVL